MQFIILGYDGDDENALARRMQFREEHLAATGKAVKMGEHLVGAAMLDEAGNMCGSMMVVDYASRTELDAWLEREVYVTNGVWKKVEVIPCRVAPTFQHVFSGKE